MNCYVCENQLVDENETEEHIILNAIGGKLKSKRLICRECNSKFGSQIDAKLAHQLKAISTLLNVKRDNGHPQNVRAKQGSKEVLIEPGGKVKLSRPHHEIEDEILHIEAPSIISAKKMLSGMKRKFPHIDIDKELNNAEIKKGKPVETTFSMDFGGKDTERAFCKMAVNFFIYSGGASKEVQHLFPFIKGEEEDAEVYYLYPRTEIFQKGKEEILHSLILKGDEERKQLYVIVELFNEFKMVVFLSRNYQGQDLYESYHYNLVTNEIVDYETQFEINPRELKKSSTKVIDQEKFQKRMQYLFQQIRNVTTSRKIEEIAGSAMERLVEEYPEDKYPFFTNEMTSKLADNVTEQIFQRFNFREN